MAWFHTLTFCKKYLCSKKLKYGINYSWTCFFYYINIFCKKSKYGIQPNFSMDRIRPPLVNFFAILKKIRQDQVQTFYVLNQMDRAVSLRIQLYAILITLWFVEGSKLQSYSCIQVCWLHHNILELCCFEEDYTIFQLK